MMRESVNAEERGDIHMTVNPSRLARLIEALCEARPDLSHDDGSPNASAIARAGIKRGHSLSQPTVSRILHGQILSPSTPVVRALADVFGVQESEIRGEVHGDEMSPLQRSIAERWSKLPKPVQDYLAAQIDQALEFAEEHPAAARALYKERSRSR